MTGRRSSRRCSSAGRIVGYDEIAVVRLDSPAPAVVRGTAMEWVDRRGLAPGRRYVYVVTATDAQGRISAPSERLAVPYLAAPPAAARPPGHRRRPADHASAGMPPAELLDGTPVAGALAYVVLRGVGSEGALEMVDPGRPGHDLRRHGARQRRRVPLRGSCGARRSAGVTRPDRPRIPVTATPADTTPPRRRPTWSSSLRRVRSASRGRPSPDDDVALYAVYRAPGAGGLDPRGHGPRRHDDLHRPRRARGHRVPLRGHRHRPRAHANESARSNEVTATAP